MLPLSNLVLSLILVTDIFYRLKLYKNFKKIDKEDSLANEPTGNQKNGNLP